MKGGLILIILIAVFVLIILVPTIPAQIPAQYDIDSEVNWYL
jgi:uncharacterized membrane protein